ncbi:hypothetical protein [Streptomyces sp. WAC 04229]|uniref:hypothetical protein n=1 Tax=Streptomyces sp. WAC 04229 TaxID=2203206 RepID=UPI003D723773
MSAAGEDRRFVVCIDLRHELDDVMNDLDQHLREAIRGDGLRPADVSRVLVIDTPEALLRHQAAYTRLRASSVVSTLLCLAVGQLPAPEDQVLGLPAALSKGDGAATLWIGDVRGIGWGPGQARPITLTNTDMAADDITGVEPLVELLRVPEVFDQTVTALSPLPNCVASPALRVLVHEVPEDDLLRAQLQALDACTLPSDERRVHSPPGGALDVLAGRAEPEDLSVEDCVPESSLLRQAHWRTLERLGEAESGVDRLTGWRGMLLPDRSAAEVVAAVRETGHALADYRETVEQAFQWVDGRAGLDADGRDHLAQMGVRLPHVPGTRPEEVGEALRRQIAARFERRTPLPEIVAWLRDFAGRATPTGSAAQLDRLHRVCPDDLLETLQDPPPPAADTDVVRPSLWAAAAALFAAAGPAGLWGTAVAALLLAAGAVRAAGSPGRVPPVMAGGLFGAWLAGAAAGTVLGASGLPVWTAAPLGVLAVLAAGFAARSLWSAAVLRWRKESGLGAVAEAVDALGEVLDQGVLGHWLLADARAVACDQAKALAHLVQTVGETLRGFAEHLGNRAQQTWSSSRAGSPASSGEADGRDGGTFAVEYVGQAGQALRTTLVGDITDLVAEVLSPYWHVVLRDPSSAVTLPVQARTDQQMLVYQRHLGQAGTTPAPPFAAAATVRPDPATLMGVDLRRIVDVLRPDSRGQALQLCSPGQLRLLDRAPTAARSFGFVPQAMQGAFWEALGGSAGVSQPRADGVEESVAASTAAHLPEIVWTASGRFAGLLRLVPLSPAAVRSGWLQEEADDAAGRPGPRSAGGQAPGAAG